LVEDGVFPPWCFANPAIWVVKEILIGAHNQVVSLPVNARDEELVQMVGTK
jgi:hypothetical protein